MRISKEEIPIKKIIEGYEELSEDRGVWALNGKLNIRPSYQREFIYNLPEQKAVIDSIINNFPLGIIYWHVHKEDYRHIYNEVLDGQQRTLSICAYIVNRSYTIIYNGTPRYFDNLPDDVQKNILNYPLDVRICEGTKEEKLNWFKRINIAGKTHSKQELRNAVYPGPWLESAKQYFSKQSCPAQDCYGKYMLGKINRQAYLETILKWISNNNIENYMAHHQHDENANELWEYFIKVMEWTETLFKYRAQMKGVQFGLLYNEYKDENFDPTLLESKIYELINDRDVTNIKGIWSYVINRDERELNIRTFNDKEKMIAYERQNGLCAHCKEQFDLKEMEADHIQPWSKGGKTVIENCQMLCKSCNRKKMAI